MTYATIATHISPVVHYFIASLLLFILLPRWLFSTSYVDWTDRWIAAYVKMVFLLIISGYVLVLTKLYEVPSLVLLFIVIICYQLVKRERGKKTDTLKVHVLNHLFNWLDGLFKFKTIEKLSTRVAKWKLTLQRKCSWNVFFEVLTLVILIGGSSYLRFYDAFANAAPPMSDSYVTLAWMKYIDARQLFHDGIYPQGFHIYLATLFKFAAVDALYILRYTGPFNSVLLILGLYMVIRKLTKNGIGAIAAAFIFGVYWVITPLSPIEINRQAATNAQEFAFVFIFPAVYFLINYLLNKRKEDLTVGLICMAIIGLVHPLAFAVVGILVGVLVVSAILILKESWRSVVYICIGSLLTVAIALAPFGVGFLLGKEFHSSSLSYLMDSAESTFRYSNLTYIDYSALGFCVLLFLYLCLAKHAREDRFIGVFTLLAGCSLFTLYFAGGIWTQNTVISSRSQELWGLIIPFCVGISISYLFKWLKEKWYFMIYISLILLAVATVILYKPTPIIPYKLEHKENIEQYLKISQNHLPKTWMSVTQAEGYSISLGTGFHMHLGDFLHDNQPEEEVLTRKGRGKMDINAVKDVFIFMEKDVFQVSESTSVYELLKPEYERRIEEYQQLAEWIKSYQQAGFSVATYFENESIRVYHLQTTKDDPRLLKNSWSR